MIGKKKIGDFGEKYPNGFVLENKPYYRAGILFAQYKGVALGIDSDRWIRHPIQDNFAHNIKLPILDTRQPGFRSYSDKIMPFVRFKTVNIQLFNSLPFSLYEIY